MSTAVFLFFVGLFCVLPAVSLVCLAGVLALDAVIDAVLWFIMGNPDENTGVERKL